MLDPDSDSLRDRIAVWLRGTYEDAIEDATGSTPAEEAWLADADGVLLVLHRYTDQAQRTRPQYEGCAHCIDRANLRERAAEFDRQAIAGMRERAMREGRTSL